MCCGIARNKSGGYSIINYKEKVLLLFLSFATANEIQRKMSHYFTASGEGYLQFES
jgi:hypothetical protein